MDRNICVHNGNEKAACYDARSMDEVKPEHRRAVALIDAVDMNTFSTIRDLPGVGWSQDFFEHDERWYDLEGPCTQ